MFKKNNGSVLVLGLLVVSVLILFGGIFLSLTVDNYKYLHADSEMLKAYWIARSGLSKTIHKYRYDYFGTVGKTEETNFNDGELKYGSISTTTGLGIHETIVVSVGKVGDKTESLMMRINISTPTDYLLFLPRDSVLGFYRNQVKNITTFYGGPIHCNGDLLFLMPKGQKPDITVNLNILKQKELRGPVISTGGNLYVSKQCSDYYSSNSTALDAEGDRYFYIGDGDLNLSVSSQSTWRNKFDLITSYPLISYVALAVGYGNALISFDLWLGGYLPFNSPSPIPMNSSYSGNKNYYYYYPNVDTGYPEVTLPVVDFTTGSTTPLIQDAKHNGYKIKIPFKEVNNLFSDPTDMLKEELKKYYKSYIDSDFSYTSGNVNEFFLNSELQAKVVIGKFSENGQYDNNKFSLPADYSQTITPNYSTRNSSGTAPHDTSENYNSNKPSPGGDVYGRWGSINPTDNTYNPSVRGIHSSVYYIRPPKSYLYSQSLKPFSGWRYDFNIGELVSYPIATPSMRELDYVCDGANITLKYDTYNQTPYNLNNITFQDYANQYGWTLAVVNSKVKTSYDLDMKFKSLTCISGFETTTGIGQEDFVYPSDYSDDGSNGDYVTTGQLGIVVRHDIGVWVRPIDNIYVSTNANSNGDAGNWTLLTPKSISGFDTKTTYLWSMVDSIQTDGYADTTPTSAGDYYTEKFNIKSTEWEVGQEIVITDPTEIASSLTSESVLQGATTFTTTNKPLAFDNTSLSQFVLSGAGAVGITITDVNPRTGVITFSGAIGVGGATIQYYHLANTSIAITRKPAIANTYVLVDQLVKAKKIDLNLITDNNHPEHDVIYSEVPLVVWGTPKRAITIVCLDDVYVGDINSNFSLDSVEAKPVGIVSSKLIWLDFARSSTRNSNFPVSLILNKVALYTYGGCRIFGRPHYSTDNKTIKLVGSLFDGMTLLEKPDPSRDSFLWPQGIQYYTTTVISPTPGNYNQPNSNYEWLYSTSFRTEPPPHIPLDIQILQSKEIRTVDTSLQFIQALKVNDNRTINDLVNKLQSTE